jgi:hypothetical protein
MASSAESVGALRGLESPVARRIAKADDMRDPLFAVGS